MSREVQVRGAGSGARVALEVHQFLAGGVKTETANSEGTAYFHLDVDAGAEVTVYVDGKERVRRGSIQDVYYV